MLYVIKCSEYTIWWNVFDFIKEFKSQENMLWCIIIHMQLQIGTVPFVLELGPSSPHKEYLPSSDNCVEMSGGNVLKTKGNFHMGTQTHCLYVCANVHFMKLSGLFFLLEPWPRRKNTRSIVGDHHSVHLTVVQKSCWCLLSKIEGLIRVVWSFFKKRWIHP